MQSLDVVHTVAVMLLLQRQNLQCMLCTACGILAVIRELKMSMTAPGVGSVCLVELTVGLHQPSTMCGASACTLLQHPPRLNA